MCAQTVEPGVGSWVEVVEPKGCSASLCVAEGASASSARWCSAIGDGGFNDDYSE